MFPSHRCSQEALQDDEKGGLKMVQNGPNDHFCQNDLIPNRILAFARPKWTILVHFGLKRFILVHLGPPTVLWPFLTIHFELPVDFMTYMYSYWIWIHYRKRAEYCFESTVSEKRTHWASLSSAANSVSSARNSVSSLWHTNNRLRGTHWVRSPELSEPRKTHWFGVWNRTPRNRIRPVSDINKEYFSRMCIHICYKIRKCKKREVRVSNSRSMASESFTYVYVYWIRNSGSTTKERALFCSARKSGCTKLWW